MRELGERTVEELRRHVAVEPRDDDTDRPAAALGDALEHRVAVRDVEIARSVLVRELDVHRRLVELGFVLGLRDLVLGDVG